MSTPVTGGARSIVEGFLDLLLAARAWRMAQREGTVRSVETAARLRLVAAIDGLEPFRPGSDLSASNSPSKAERACGADRGPWDSGGAT